MSIRLGIERLAAEGRDLVAGRRIGLITNHTGVDHSLVPAGDLLRQAGARIAALFGPEHGVRGLAAAGAHVASSCDRTATPVYSLYGERTKPEPAMLADLDALVYDIQDIGSRYYTFLSTLALCAQAAGEAGLPLIVCDRPNPITGLHPGGNVAERAFYSFVGIAGYPMRHAMTVGELALFFRSEYGMGRQVHVMEMEGWRRDMWWDQTGLCFVPPSPNSTGIDMALLYPGTCLLEGTNVSEGRGFTKPYEIVGAPWIDGEALALALGGSGLPGVRVRATGFRPFAGKYAGEECEGVQLHVCDRDAVRPAELGVHLLAAIARLHPGRLEYRAPHFDRLAGTGRLRCDLQAGRPVMDILADWRAQLDEFVPVRERCLLYP